MTAPLASHYQAEESSTALKHIVRSFDDFIDHGLPLSPSTPNTSDSSSSGGSTSMTVRITLTAPEFRDDESVLYQIPPLPTSDSGVIGPADVLAEAHNGGLGSGLGGGLGLGLGNTSSGGMLKNEGVVKRVLGKLRKRSGTGVMITSADVN